MPKKLPNSDTNPTPQSFEDAMSELNQLVIQMENGNLPLEASVSAYQRGAELIAFCTKQLETVEQQVKVFEAGMLTPFAIDTKASEGE